MNNDSGWTINVDIANPLLVTLLDCDATESGSYDAGSGTAHLVDRSTVTIEAKASGPAFNAELRAQLESTAGVDILEYLATDVLGGTIGGADFGGSLDYYFAGVLSQGGTGVVRRIITRDPIGVDVRLTRGTPVKVAVDDPDQNQAMQDIQTDTMLTVGSGDEVAEHYSAQVVLEGNVAYLSFFADADSIPQVGDVLTVAYRYGVDIKVTVQDDASIQLVKSRSKIPGDNGIREGTNLDVSDKIFSSQGAVVYAKQYLEPRANLYLQGSVNSSSWHTQGAIPLSGQNVPIQLPAENLKRTEVITQVISTHHVASHFDFAISFGSLPDEFLVPVENPAISSSPSALTYNVRALTERCSLINEINIEVL